MKICPMQYGRQDIEVVVSLPEKSKGYFRSKSKTQNRKNFLRGTKALDWYPKQISNGKYRDKKEIYAGIFCDRNKRPDRN